VSTPLKNMKISLDDYSQYMDKQKHVPNHQPDKHLKPPTIHP
jgi:hypothetical protein